MNNIETCGICGKKAVLSIEFSLKDGTAFFTLACHCCGNIIVTGENKEEVIQKWNYLFPSLFSNID